MLHAAHSSPRSSSLPCSIKSKLLSFSREVWRSSTMAGRRSSATAAWHGPGGEKWHLMSFFAVAPPPSSLVPRSSLSECLHLHREPRCRELLHVESFLPEIPPTLGPTPALASTRPLAPSVRTPVPALAHGPQRRPHRSSGRMEGSAPKGMMEATGGEDGGRRIGEEDGGWRRSSSGTARALCIDARFAWEKD
jgi:hypothetical protein